MLTTLLLGSLLATGVAQADDTWTEQKVETAVHDVLAHGDLSDIDFLAKTLGMELEVVQWGQPDSLHRELMTTLAISRVSEPASPTSARERWRRE